MLLEQELHGHCRFWQISAGLKLRLSGRSEAKRLMRGLERFQEVLVDFTGREEVGQGFVDEVLRVWPSQHPGTAVQPTGMTGPVEFMVKRGLPTPREETR
jgi:hypothetical protein